VKNWVSLMTMRTLAKALLLLTITIGVPSVARPASAAVRAAQGRRHHHRQHERRRERHREHEREHEHAGDGERHGEL
jgi:Ni/Co efflux regulator RcnB